jgi:hypothetical protein
LLRYLLGLKKTSHQKIYYDGDDKN